MPDKLQNHGFLLAYIMMQPVFKLSGIICLKESTRVLDSMWQLLVANNSTSIQAIKQISKYLNVKRKKVICTELDYLRDQPSSPVPNSKRKLLLLVVYKHDCDYAQHRVCENTKVAGTKGR